MAVVSARCLVNKFQFVFYCLKSHEIQINRRKHALQNSQMSKQGAAKVTALVQAYSFPQAQLRREQCLSPTLFLYDLYLVGQIRQRLFFPGLAQGGMIPSAKLGPSWPYIIYITKLVPSRRISCGYKPLFADVFWCLLSAFMHATSTLEI